MAHSPSPTPCPRCYQDGAPGLAMSPQSQSGSMQAAATLALSAGCELDLLDEQFLSELGTSQLSRTDICAYLADQWAPLIEVLSGDGDRMNETWQTAPDGTTTVITTAGAIGIAWTMSVRH